MKSGPVAATTRAKEFRNMAKVSESMRYINMKQPQAYFSKERGTCQMCRNCTLLEGEGTGE